MSHNFSMTDEALRNKVKVRGVKNGCTQNLQWVANDLAEEESSETNKT